MYLLLALCHRRPPNCCHRAQFSICACRLFGFEVFLKKFRFSDRYELQLAEWWVFAVGEKAKETICKMRLFATTIFSSPSAICNTFLSLALLIYICILFVAAVEALFTQSSMDTPADALLILPPRIFRPNFRRSSLLVSHFSWLFCNLNLIVSSKKLFSALTFRLQVVAVVIPVAATGGN